MSKDLFQKKLAIHLVGWLLITMHFLVFSQFLPNAQGKLGHDYAYNLPMLLDGYYWFLNNGLFSLPWFTPSFCGGMPLLANPATFYYSTAQFLTFVVDPLTSVRCTFFLFAALGFWGFYTLLTRIFATSRTTGLLGGTLFLFNGLYTYRFIVGHLEFHAFMLVPFLAWILLRDKSGALLPGRKQLATDVIVAGLIICYMFMSGMTQLLIPALLGVILIALVKALDDPDGRILWRFAAGFALAGMLALALSAVKLVAALAFLHNFQRDSYLLPGVASLGQLLWLLLRVTVLGGEGIDSDPTIVNAEFALGRHELEYGLSIVPFVLLALAVVPSVTTLPARLEQFRQPQRLFCLGMILLLLLIPLALNYYSPAWNLFLKSVPIIKSLSNFFRWFIIYLPFLVLLSCLVAERHPWLRQQRSPLFLAALVIIVGQNLLTDKAFYAEQPYDPGPVQAAYQRVRALGKPPVIRNLTVPTDMLGRTALTGNRNDALVNGDSQLLCYEPMFGFRLEFLPFKSSHPGPTLSTAGGVFNLKNPACYLYPQENRCQPGDHFRLDQRSEAEDFISFRPYAYQMSAYQEAANWLSLLTWLGVLLFGGVSLWSGLRGLLPAHPKTRR
ncbi:MAG: hypothetical protein HGA96_04580 [Desulfobulbaceae bacterium]|nr:hypothetical protein [Desulfobulbaceae bacterium]